MTRTSTARHALLAGFVALTFGVAACGDDDGEGGDDTTSEDTVTDDTVTDDTVTTVTTETTAAVDTATDDTATDDTATEGTGGDGGDVDLDAYVAAASEELGFEDQGVAECLARALLDNIDPADIAASGASPEEFVGAESIAAVGIEVTDEMRAVMYADASGCTGLENELVTSQFSDDPETAACVSDVLDDEIVAEVFVAQLTAGEPSDEAIAAQAETQACSADG